MSQLSIQLAHGKRVYAPGETLQGQVRWHFERPPDSIELVVFWHTEGRALSESGISSRVHWQQPGQRGERPFSFSLPEGPHTFRGKLISLSWAVEAIQRPGKQHAQVSFVLSPTGAELVLPELEPDGAPGGGPVGFRPSASRR